MTFLLKINISPVQGFIFLFLMAACKNELVEFKWLITRSSYYSDKVSTRMCSDSNPNFWIRSNWISFFKILYSSVKQGTFLHAGAVVFTMNTTVSIWGCFIQNKCQHTICSFIFLTKSKLISISIYNYSQLKIIHSEIFYISSLQVFFSHLSLSPIYYRK